MKIIIAPDSFKGSLSAIEAADAIGIGWKRVFPDAEIVYLPVADGGEGTAQILASATGGTLYTVNVTGPLGEPVNAHYAVLGSGTTVVVELAQAAGLTQVPEGKRDPKYTSTYGVGELLRIATDHPGANHLILTLGGSATNDGGAGAMEALGVVFRDSQNHTLSLQKGIEALGRLDTVLLDTAERLTHWTVDIACDVDNPLLGVRGASAVFGPQKGATPQDVELLDTILTRFADVLTVATGRDIRTVPGTGAAGGAAAGFLYLFPQAQLRPGIDIVLDAIGFAEAVRDADVVLTGEGRMDTQTLSGKVIAGIARRAKQINPDVFVGAMVGAVAPDLDLDTMTALGVDAVMPLVPGPISLTDAMTNGAKYLTDATDRAARWYRRMMPK